MMIIMMMNKMTRQLIIDKMKLREDRRNRGLIEYFKVISRDEECTRDESGHKKN